MSDRLSAAPINAYPYIFVHNVQVQILKKYVMKFSTLACFNSIENNLNGISFATTYFLFPILEKSLFEKISTF